MNKRELARIISDRDYAKGVEFFREHSDNTFLKTYFLKEHSEYRESRLFEELEKMQSQTTDGGDIEVSVENDDVKQVLFKAKEAFRAIKMKRQYLFSEDRETRRKAALEILELSRLNKECWNKYDFFKKHGALPQPVASTSIHNMTALELSKQLSLDKNFVWKYSKQIESLKGEKRRNLLLEIERRKARILSIQGKLQVS